MSNVIGYKPSESWTFRQQKKAYKTVLQRPLTTGNEKFNDKKLFYFYVISEANFKVLY